MKKGVRIVFLRGRKIVLRPMRKATDLETALRWINDPEVTRHLTAYLPSTSADEAEWFDGLSKRRDADIILAIETLNGKFIGIMGLHRINWKDRTAVTGALIGEKAYWGRGYGTDAKMTLLDYAFNVLNIRKIGSAVIAFNKRSLRYSLHCGYKIEGRRRKQHFKNGRYYDEIVLGLFRKDWLPVWKRYERSGRV